MSVVWTAHASLSAAPLTLLIPLPFTSNGPQIHKFTLTAVSLQTCYHSVISPSLTCVFVTVNEAWSHFASTAEEVLYIFYQCLWIADRKTEDSELHSSNHSPNLYYSCSPGLSS